MPDPITLTRAERDVILDNLHQWSPVDPVTFATREEASATLEGLQRAFLVSDELGRWTAEDSRDEFTTTVDPVALVELLRTIGNASEEGAAYDRAGLERARGGDRGYWFTDTLEKTVRTYQEQIQRYDHEVRACEDLLARLANGAGDTLPEPVGA